MTDRTISLTGLEYLARTSGAFFGLTVAGIKPATAWREIAAYLHTPEWSEWLSAQETDSTVSVLLRETSAAWQLLGFQPPWTGPPPAPPRWSQLSALRPAPWRAPAATTPRR